MTEHVWASPTAALGLLLGCASLVATGCLHPAEERARADEAVGRAQTDETKVRVDEGLATVRHLSSRSLRLWAGAPTFRGSLEVGDDDAGAWELELENVSPGVELSVTREAGSAVPVTLLAQPVPTRRTFGVTLVAGRYRLDVTVPEVDTTQPFRFGLLSDIQEAIGEFHEVVDLVSQQQGLHWVAGAGDLTQRGTEDELIRFQRELARMNVPYYTTLGNHELGEDPPPYHAYFGRGSFSFVYRGVRFTLLDSASATIEVDVYDWLDRWLDQGRDQVHVVAMHIPPLDPSGTRGGAFASRPEAAKLLSKLTQGGVDLTLYGHIHSYYRFDNAGIEAHISGGGGARPEKLDGIERHFMVFELSAERGLIERHVVRVD